MDVFLGRPGGGEDRRLVFDANSGTLLRTDTYVDKPLIHRIHSGEAFGDGGLVFAMLWGTTLAFLTVSGLHHLLDDAPEEPHGAAAGVLVELRGR